MTIIVDILLITAIGMTIAVIASNRFYSWSAPDTSA